MSVENMEQYLETTKYATEVLIKLINEEEIKLGELKIVIEEFEQEINKAEKELQHAKGMNEFTSKREDFTFLLIEKEKLERESRKIKADFENK